MIECAARHSQSKDVILSSFEDPAPVPRIYISFRKDKPHATIARTVKNLNAGNHVNMVQLPNLRMVTSS